MLQLQMISITTTITQPLELVSPWILIRHPQERTLPFITSQICGLQQKFGATKITKPKTTHIDTTAQQEHTKHLREGKETRE